MFYGKSKKVIILRNIHSNLFEEAILVLKEDKEQEKEEVGVLASAKKNNVKSDFILKEAEQIINNYIRENKGKFNNLPKKKQLVNANSKFMKNVIINFALFGSIAAVIFLLIKFLL